jgi:hypothetical protein
MVELDPNAGLVERPLRLLRRDWQASPPIEGGDGAFTASNDVGVGSVHGLLPT